MEQKVDRVAIKEAMAPLMQMQCISNAKERKGKEKKGKSIIDTNVSKSDAEHPTRERVGYKTFFCFSLIRKFKIKDCSKFFVW